jgi:acetyl esterase/lipase
MIRPLANADILARLDPDLLGVIASTLPAHLPPGALTVESVRAIDASLVAKPVESARVERITRADGSRLEVRLHDASDPGAVILWIHGGGMFLGEARQDDALCASLSTDLGVSVASADYRLAPEHPHPEPLEDCYAALEWLSTRFGTIVVAGASAGGGLAAGLALLARDRSGPSIAALHLFYPMLDDRGATRSSTELADTVVWNARLNRVAWSAYLGGEPADGYAAPARSDDLSGLPRTVIETGDLDLFVDEDVDFASRLRAAGVDVHLVVESGAPHCFEFIVPDTYRGRAAMARTRAALADGLRIGERA